MSFVSNKQQRLIEESTSNFVKFYDKITSQYLKLRQEIFQTNVKISQEILGEHAKVSEESRIKVQSLIFELDRVIETYKTHISETVNSLEIRKTCKPPYVQQLKSEYAALRQSIDIIGEEITDIKDIQKPILDKMQSLVKSFDNLSGTKRVGVIDPRKTSTVYEHTESSVNLNSLIFTYDQIKELFEDVNLNSTDDEQVETIKNLEEQLKNAKALDNFEDGKYQYVLSKSSLHDMGRNTTIAEYDKAIEQAVAGIKGLLADGSQTKERWSDNARRLEVIKDALRIYDETGEI